MLRKFLVVGLLVLASAFSCLGLSLHTLEGRLLIPGVTEIPAIKIVLDHGIYSTLTREDGSFSIYGVAPGTYALTVLTKHFAFPLCKVDINEESGRVRALLYAYPGAPKEKAVYPLQLKALGKATFFEVRQPFDVLGMFKNPMMIFMVISMVIVFAAPKMMEGMDPEQLAKMRGEGEEDVDLSTPSGIFNALMGNEETKEPGRAVAPDAASSGTSGQARRRR